MDSEADESSQSGSTDGGDIDFSGVDESSKSGSIDGGDMDITSDGSSEYVELSTTDGETSVQDCVPPNEGPIEHKPQTEIATDSDSERLRIVILGLYEVDIQYDVPLYCQLSILAADGRILFSGETIDIKEGEVNLPFPDFCQCNLVDFVVFDVIADMTLPGGRGGKYLLGRISVPFENVERADAALNQLPSQSLPLQPATMIGVERKKSTEPVGLLETILCVLTDTRTLSALKLSEVPPPAPSDTDRQQTSRAAGGLVQQGEQYSDKDVINWQESVYNLEPSEEYTQELHHGVDAGDYETVFKLLLLLEAFEVVLLAILALKESFYFLPIKFLEIHVLALAALCCM